MFSTVVYLNESRLLFNRPAEKCFQVFVSCFDSKEVDFLCIILLSVQEQRKKCKTRKHIGINSLIVYILHTSINKSKKITIRGEAVKKNYFVLQ